MLEIIIIAAIAQNGVIGKDNKMPWHIPADFKHFKELTTGYPVIMGSNTFESLPNGALPKRKNIVLAFDKSYSHPDITVKHSWDEGVEFCKQNQPDRIFDYSKVFIIGGAMVYKTALEYADRLELTRVLKDYEGNISFPEIDYTGWELISEKKGFMIDKQGEKTEYVFESWKRRR